MRPKTAKTNKKYSVTDRTTDGWTDTAKCGVAYHATKKTETRLPQLRVDEQGPYVRSLDHLGRTPAGLAVRGPRLGF